jgi:hypothetical protein
MGSAAPQRTAGACQQSQQHSHPVAYAVVGPPGPAAVAVSTYSGVKMEQLDARYSHRHTCLTADGAAAYTLLG